jgi:hypothetical protein
MLRSDVQKQVTSLQTLGESRFSYRSSRRIQVVHEDNKYLLTDDLRNSSLAGVLGAAHAIGGIIVGNWTYPEFETVMAKSEFPSYFYDVH